MIVTFVTARLRKLKEQVGREFSRGLKGVFFGEYEGGVYRGTTFAP
jgi:hypothetical protein